MPAPLAMAAVSTALELGKSTLGAVSGRPSSAPDKVRTTAQDFESMFLENALQRLTESAGTDGPLGENGTGGGVYRSLLVKEYAGQISKRGGIGIADQVYRELMRIQEAQRAG